METVRSILQRVVAAHYGDVVARLASKVDVGRATASRWLSGETVPEYTTAREIEALHPETAAGLLIAWERESKQTRRSQRRNDARPDIVSTMPDSYGSEAWKQAGLWISKLEEPEHLLFNAALLALATTSAQAKRTLATLAAALPPGRMQVAREKLEEALTRGRPQLDATPREATIPVSQLTSPEWVCLECQNAKCPGHPHRFWEVAGELGRVHCPLNGNPETHPEADLRVIARARFQPTSHAEGA